MGLSDDNTEENEEQRYEDVCLDLNLDKVAKEEAWKSFERISQNYTLEVSFVVNFRGSRHVCFESSKCWILTQIYLLFVK